MMNSHDQKVPCEGGGVLGKTTDEAESEYIQIWKRERERERDMVMSITLYASAW